MRLEATASPLEGSRWLVKMTPEAAGPFEDTLVFEGGRVRSSSFARAGFAATPYSLVSSPAGWSLRAVQTSEDKEMCVWTFVIDDARVHGTVTCSRKGRADSPYAVEGKRIGKQQDQEKEQEVKP